MGAWCYGRYYGVVVDVGKFILVLCRGGYGSLYGEYRFVVGVGEYVLSVCWWAIGCRCICIGAVYSGCGVMGGIGL